MQLSGNEIRQQFIDFFSKKYHHSIVPSASLVPGGDQTLLFTNSGMVQFKDVFLGTDVREYTRAVNSQKCMRVAGKHNDLDDVGRDDFHHTFFEMLGNWSFGDYYKDEAISWAWELLTSIWKLDKSKLWVTVFTDELDIIPWDEEAYSIWKKQPGLDPTHILKFGRKDNLWEMAETGPCGPCSEIHMDFGQQFCEKKEIAGHVCRVNGDCHRFVELWNLVFIQYNRVSSEKFMPLPKKHVDTGMGFERIVSVLQGVSSNYRTDLLEPLILKTQELSHATDEQRDEQITPYRVISDHARAAAFLIADGVIPGNTGRNYVCRMIIRRASRFGGKIGLHKPFLADVAQKVIDGYSNFYPELVKHQNLIISSIKKEEEQFHKTLDNANLRLEEMIEGMRNSTTRMLDGESCFELFATHGLPLEIIKDILREQGFEANDQEFHEALEKHKIISSLGRNKQNKNEDLSNLYKNIYENLTHRKLLPLNGVKHDPYGTLTSTGKILVILKNGSEVDSAEAGEQVEVIVPTTAFYIESGGQVSDKGYIEAHNGLWRIDIEEVFKPAPGIIIHKGKVVKGHVQVNDEASVQVDENRRSSIMRNHSATHLLHSALHKYLGDTARQAGSLVAEDKLRFDFTYPSALTSTEIARIEGEVNRVILSNMDREVREEDLKTATQAGAMALFGEKYGSEVRTVTFRGEKPFSYELCGGTHVENTSQIGLFVIISEGSVAAGIRRIEAITGWEAYKYAQKHIQLIEKTAKFLNTNVENIYQAVVELTDELHDMDREIAKIKNSLINDNLSALFDKTIKIKDISVLAAEVKAASPENLRTISDRFKEKFPDGIAILGTVRDDKPFIIIASVGTAIQKGLDAKKLINIFAPIMDGKGGGNEKLAQAGGKNLEALATLISKAPEMIAKMLN